MASINVISLCTLASDQNKSRTNSIQGSVVISSQNIYINTINTGMLFNAIKDIKCVITKNIINVYSDNTPFIDSFIKKNFYDLLKQPYIDKSTFNTFFIPLISSIYDNIEYPNSLSSDINNPSRDDSDSDNTDLIATTPFHLRGHDVSSTTSKPFNSYKSDTNIDYVDNAFIPDTMHDVYEEIIRDCSSHNNNYNVIKGNRMLSDRLDQLSNLNNRIESLVSRNNDIVDKLYDRNFITGIGTHKYNSFNINNGKLVNNELLYTTELISKIYIIKSTKKPDVFINIRGIDIPYDISQMSNNVYICKLPQYLLVNNKKYDIIASARYVRIESNDTNIFKIENNNYINIRYMDNEIKTIPTDDDLYQKNISNLNILKK